jgi:glycerate 2-kinase
LPASLARALAPGGDLQETPKSGDPAFRNAHFALVLGLHDLIHPAHCAAEACGCTTICDNSTDDWPIARAADHLLRQLAHLRDANPGRRVAVIADGEVSSPVTGDGIGGRNGAFVLDCVAKISDESIAVLSAGTDGIDGSSPAAGAVADGQTLDRAHALGLDVADFQRRSDSYSFFNALGDAIETGPTGNNLRDLRILIAD